MSSVRSSGFALKLPKRNSFIGGFLSAIALVVVYHLLNHSGMRGGVHAESPNGIYELSIMAPLSPQYGDAYDITLTDQRTKTVVRRIVITVPSSERTVAIRGGGGNVDWDTANQFADFNADGKTVIRVWVP